MKLRITRFALSLAALLFLLPLANAGIAGFQAWFSKAFPTAVTDTKPYHSDTFDHVCFDMNELLHISIRRSATTESAVSKVFKEVNKVLMKCHPLKSVVFAFDGSAPLAKLVVQQRRRKGFKFDGKSGMDPLQLTPGTEFMDTVSSAMEFYAHKAIQTDARFKGVRFYVSGTRSPGEGELKCIDWVKLSTVADGEDSVVIVGGDADLVLQGLALSKVKNMFVLVLNQKGNRRIVSMWEVIRSLDARFPGQSEYIRTDLMVILLLNGNDYLPKSRGVGFDRCFDTYLTVLQRNGGSYLIDGENRTFNWVFLKDYFDELASRSYAADASKIQFFKENPSPYQLLREAVAQGQFEGENSDEIAVFELEEEVLVTMLGERGMQENCQQQELSEMMADHCLYRTVCTVGGKKYQWVHHAKRTRHVVHEAALMIIKENLPGVYELYLEQEDRRIAFGNLSQEEKDKESSQLLDVGNYLKGLLWNLQMYVDGYTPDMYYHYQQSYAPSSREISDWVRANEAELHTIRSPMSHIPPLPATLACLGVMPMNDEGRKFVPRHLTPLLSEGSAVSKALTSGVKNALDVPMLVKAVQAEAPHELQSFWSNSYYREVWIVVQEADIPTGPLRSTRQRLSLRHTSGPLPPPSNRKAPLGSKGIVSLVMEGTRAPPCEIWSTPGTREASNQPEVVSRIQYKKAFKRVLYQPKELNGVKGGGEGQGEVQNREEGVGGLGEEEITRSTRRRRRYKGGPTASLQGWGVSGRDSRKEDWDLERRDTIGLNSHNFAITKRATRLNRGGVRAVPWFGTSVVRAPFCSFSLHI